MMLKQIFLFFFVLVFLASQSLYSADSGVKEDFKDAGHSMKEGFKTTGHGIKKGAKKTGKAFKSGGKSFKNEITK